MQSSVKWKSYTMVLLLILMLVFWVIDVVSNTAWVSPTEFWTHEDVAAPPLLLLETVQNHKSWQNSPGGNSIFKTTKINPAILGHTVYTHCLAAICKALPLWNSMICTSYRNWHLRRVSGDVMEVAPGWQGNWLASGHDDRYQPQLGSRLADDAPLLQLCQPPFFKVQTEWRYFSPTSRLYKSVLICKGVKVTSWTVTVNSK